ncbi:MAG: ribonuclease P protein component [Deltaproteobacteria bacterium]|nr:ribonuclease P protein component [Deltaproteobacteria bacterium]
MVKQTFGKRDRIRKRKEYQNIYSKGVRRYSIHFTAIACPNPSGLTRLGLSVGKKVGNAVKRNRMKRLVREFFRLNKDRLPASQDIVIIGRKMTQPLTYQGICKELEHLLISKTSV